jgi:hypothetical protein
MSESSILLHIGYHKTGTTWLQKHVFSSSSYGFISPMSIKEILDEIILPHPLDFDSGACRRAITRRLAAVASSGLLPVISNERFSGHPHSGGYDSSTLADRLKQLFPEAHVFICIRQQEDVILSCYNQYIRTGGAISIASYLNVGDRTRIPLFDFRHFMYHRLIAYYQKLFGREAVLVLPFNLFSQDNVGYVSRIIEFATGERSRFDLSTLPGRDMSNRSITGFELKALTMVNYLIGTRNSINQFSLFPTGRERTRSLFRFLQRLDPLIPQSINKHIVDDLHKTVAATMGDRYRQSNQMTSELIGMDLGQFGFQV